MQIVQCVSQLQSLCISDPSGLGVLKRHVKVRYVHFIWTYNVGQDVKSPALMFSTVQPAEYTSLLIPDFNYQCQNLAGYEKDKHVAYVVHVKPQILPWRVKSYLLLTLYTGKKNTVRNGGKGVIMGYKCWEDESWIFIKCRNSAPGSGLKGFDEKKQTQFLLIQVMRQWRCSGSWWNIWWIVFRSDLRTVGDRDPALQLCRWLCCAAMGQWPSDKRRRTKTGTWDLLDWCGCRWGIFIYSIPG